jgi:hypothetical protein
VVVYLGQELSIRIQSDADAVYEEYGKARL